MGNKEKINVLLGGARPNGGGSGDDWKAKYESLKSEYDKCKPMLGRVEQLPAKDRRIAELEAEVAKLKSGNRAAEVVAGLTDAERGEISPDVLEAQARIAGKVADGAIGSVKSEIEKMKQEREAEREAARERMANDFVERIEQRFPKFLQSISEGGDKQKSWSSFLVHNAASVNDAFNRCDYNALVYHIERFYREVLDVRPPKAPGNAIVPDPSSTGGGDLPSEHVEDPEKKRYTAKEYDALDEKCMRLRRAGKFEEYNKLREELDSALSEGRIDD